jgi:hypothetical protein
MNRKFSSACLILLISLAGCSSSTMIDKIAPDAVAKAKTYFDQLRNREYSDIQNAPSKRIKDPNLQATLAGVAAHIPNEDPTSVKTVGAYVRCNNHTCETTITLEYKFPSQWLLFKVVSESEDGEYSVTGVWVQPLTESLEDSNRFTLRGKSFYQYIVLSLAVLLPTFTIYIFVLCVRTKGLKGKWMWAIFIPFGFGKLSILWTTGESQFQLLAAQIPTASAHAQFYGPWVIAISIPIGAILFWLYERFPHDAQLPDPPANDPQPGAASDVPNVEGVS